SCGLRRPDRGRVSVRGARFCLSRCGEPAARTVERLLRQARVLNEKRVVDELQIVGSRVQVIAFGEQDAVALAGEPHPEERQLARSPGQRRGEQVECLALRQTKIWVPDDLRHGGAVIELEPVGFRQTHPRDGLLTKGPSPAAKAAAGECVVGLGRACRIQARVAALVIRALARVETKPDENALLFAVRVAGPEVTNARPVRDEVGAEGPPLDVGLIAPDGRSYVCRYR